MKNRSLRANIALFVLTIAFFQGADLLGVARAHDESELFGIGVAINLGLFALGLGLFAWNIATYKRSAGK